MRILRAVSEKSGVDIVASSGLYYFENCYTMSRSEDEIASWFIDEFKLGIEGTDIKPGILKCASQDTITDNNRKRLRAGLEPLPPLYTAEEAAKCLEIFRGVEYDQIVDVAENIQVRFNDAGHMLGSSIIEIWANENGKETKIYSFLQTPILYFSSIPCIYSELSAR